MSLCKQTCSILRKNNLCRFGISMKNMKDFCAKFKFEFKQLSVGSSNHQAIAAGIVEACINYGLLGRNLYQLCTDIPQNEKAGNFNCRGIFNL